MLNPHQHYNNKKNLLEYSPDNKIVKVKFPGEKEFKTYEIMDLPYIRSKTTEI